MRFYSLEKLINLYDGYSKAFKIDQYNLLLIQINGQPYLLESHCPHRGHPLSEADIDAQQLRCPLHGYCFDIASGALLQFSEEPCRGLQVFDIVYQQTELGLML